MTHDILKNPPEEADIVSGWRAERGHLVSVCMQVFNHARFLRDAFNSILNQKTDFGFEIIVHDDASQDSSADIIQEYAARYPSIVKPILQKINQYSQGIYPSLHFIYPRARLPFVAMCEGDDHWTDKDKLQVQVDGLTSRPEINFSFHRAKGLNFDETDHDEWICGDYSCTDTIVPFIDILHRARGLIPFASCMIRQQVKQRLQAFQLARPYLTLGDLYCQYFGALPNGALFIAREMSVYRFRTDQSWTHKAFVDPAFKARHETAMVRSYVELDLLTGRQYHDSFRALILQRILWLFNPTLPPRTLPEIDRWEEIHTACQDAIDRSLRNLAQAPARYVIFGCATGCQRVLDTIPLNRIVAIIDRDNRKIGDAINGKPVIGTDALEEHRDCEIIVSTITANRGAISRLTELAGIPSTNVHYMFDSALSAIDKLSIPAASQDSGCTLSSNGL